MKRFQRISLTVAMAMLAGLLLGSVSAGAQSDQDMIELSRAIVQTERKAIVAANMEFTEAESKGFWPIFREFKAEQDKLDDQLFDLIKQFAKNYETLTDDAAKILMREYMAIEKAELDIKKKYQKKFSKILPAKKVLRFFQVENKLDAVVKADLTAQIPLAQ